jgi:hypothetical protein
MVQQVADAVLYEGYLLYPYRSSSVKNRQRWNFGVLYPRGYAESQDGADSDRMQTEFLGRGRDLEIRIRFLQLITRETRNADGAPVDSWQEAIERQSIVSAPSVDALIDRPLKKSFQFEGGREYESSTVSRLRESLQGAVRVSATGIGDGWFRLRIEITNESGYLGCDRTSALPHSFVSTHAIVRLGEGEFVSLLEPPEHLLEASGHCESIGLQAVLAGEAGSRDVMLCSPVILYDYPQVAPESAGALFDGTEIDEILSLRILTMTDEEKLEMRHLDKLARRLLERTEALTPAQFMKMHGALRRSAAGGKP